jgi:4-hydroxybenzoate polyprenyltransferase
MAMTASRTDHPAPAAPASIAHLPAWAMERFPPDHWVMFLVMWATALVAGRALTGSGDLAFAPADLLGFAAAWCFFLMLRVFDEHKDYDLDLANHPGRVLQSGRITLGHLKVLGGIAIATQLGASLLLDGWAFGSVTCWWLLVIGWSSLMAKEFFVGEWLEQRLILYAASHMVVMPMALLWMAQMGAGQEAMPPAVGLLAGLSFLSGAAFEITRKLKGADEERDSIASYSQILGPTAGAATVLGLLVGAAGLLALLLDGVFAGDVGLSWHLGLAALLLGPAVTLHLYKNKPSARGRKANEAAVGVTMLGSYALLIAAFFAAADSVTWG